MSKKRRASLLRRIYVSDVEIKQTNNKAIITLYIINTERRRMIYRYFKKEVLKKIKIFLNELIIYLTKEIYISENSSINIKIWKNYKLFIKNIDKAYTNIYWYIEHAGLKLKKKVFFSLKKLILNLNKLKYNKKMKSFSHFIYKINNYEFNRFIWFYFFEIKNVYLLQLIYKLKFKYLINESYQEIKLKNKIKELDKKFKEWKILMIYIEEFYRRNIYLKIKDKKNQILDINIFNIQFNKDKKYIYPYKLYVKKLDKTFSYLYKLNNFINKILKKKIEFNIISLKSFVYNSDIFTKSLSLKLKKRKYFSVFKGMKEIINNIKLPNVNSIIERSNLKEKKDYLLVDNKYKNNNLSSNKNLLNKFNKKDKNCEYNNIYQSLLYSVKYKNIGGLKLEVKGRLTKRYRADRAIYKLNWIGGLKNIESSFNKLSTTLYRGYSKPNVTYSFFKSKRRIGAFAAKGWVSGK